MMYRIEISSVAEAEADEAFLKFSQMVSPERAKQRYSGLLQAIGYKAAIGTTELGATVIKCCLLGLLIGLPPTARSIELEFVAMLAGSSGA
ncbi:MAG: hypothetical protein IGR76_17520 [Synechococcales cyanobacterium T60_A2020_003]|nr:hypothetical protein [Synechococcales cyanobacterium T60_A2020_003]